MRTIKFRGKSLNGEWVYGYLYELPLECGNVCMILTTDNMHEDNSLRPQYHLAFTLRKDLFVVNPSTIGQFTGLLDKNGKEIYEGDLVKYTRYKVRSEYIKKDVIENVYLVYWDVIENVYLVYWNEEKHAFYCTTKFESGGGASGYLDFHDERAEREEIEVIGNIHDNPELIKD